MAFLYFLSYEDSIFYITIYNSNANKGCEGLNPLGYFSKAFGKRWLLIRNDNHKPDGSHICTWHPEKQECDKLLFLSKILKITPEMCQQEMCLKYIYGKRVTSLNSLAKLR